MSGGGPVPSALKQAWRDELKLPLVESYGQSELGGFVGLGFPYIEEARHFEAVGLPLPDKEAGASSMRDDQEVAGRRRRRSLPAWRLHAGLLGSSPEKTAEALRGGWLHTEMPAPSTATVMSPCADASPS